MCSVEAAMLIYSAYYTSEAQKNEGEYQSGVAKYNKRVAENTAQKERNRGTEEENIQRRKTAELLSKQRAELGASNVSLEAGTALQLQQNTVALGEADALRIRANTEQRVSALMTKGELLGKDAENALTAAKNKSTGTLLSGAASVAGTGVADKWFTPDSAAVAGDAYQPARVYGRGR